MKKQGFKLVIQMNKTMFLLSEWILRISQCKIYPNGLIPLIYFMKNLKLPQ